MSTAKDYISELKGAEMTYRHFGAFLVNPDSVVYCRKQQLAVPPAGFIGENLSEERFFPKPLSKDF